MFLQYKADSPQKRKRREYRVQRKALFSHQIPNYSYEGRTRGKRMKYTFSDDEGGSNEGVPENDGLAPRRSGRNSRGASTAPEAPRYTASGRLVKRPTTGPYAEPRYNGAQETSTGAGTPVSGPSEDGDMSLGAGTRTRKSAAQLANFRMSMSRDGSADSGGDDEAPSHHSEEEYQDDGSDGTDEEHMSDGSIGKDELARKKSLVVHLSYNRNGPIGKYFTRSKGAAPIILHVKRPVALEETVNGNGLAGDGPLKENEAGIMISEEGQPATEARPGARDMVVNGSATTLNRCEVQGLRLVNQHKDPE